MEVGPVRDAVVLRIRNPNLGRGRLAELRSLIAEVRAGGKKVYADLFEAEGSELYLKPASLYFDTFPKKATFADMMAIAVKRDEICLGLRSVKDANNYEKNFGIKLNPKKDTMYTLGPEDSLVVLAEDEL